MGLNLKKSSYDCWEFSVSKENRRIAKLNENIKRNPNLARNEMNIFFENSMKTNSKVSLFRKLLFYRIPLITKERINLCLAKQFIVNLPKLKDFEYLKESYLNKVDFKPISNYIKDLLTEESKEILFNIILLSKSTDSICIASSNAITILNKAEFLFTNKDLSFIKIPNADLSYGVFYNTNFSHSNLYKVNFNKAHIYNSNFKNCNMNETNFREKVFELKFNAEIFEFSRCGRFLAAASYKKIILYDSKTNQEITEFSRHNAQINFLSFSDNGNYLVSCSSDSFLILWDTSSKIKLKLFIGTKQFASFSSCNKYLCFVYAVTPGIKAGTISIYDINLDQVTKEIKYGMFVPRFSFLSQTGNSLIALYKDLCAISKWDLSKNSPEMRINFQSIQTCFAVSRCRKCIAVPVAYNKIAIYDIDKFELAAKLEIMPSSTYLAFSPCGRFLASASGDKNIEVFDLTSSKCKILDIFNRKELKIKPFTFSSDGKYLFVGTTNQKLKSWEISPILEMDRKQNMRAEITAASFSFNNKYFAASTGDGWVFIFFIKNTKLFKEFKAHKDSISSVSWSGNIIATTSSADYTIKFWDIYSSSPLKILRTSGDVCRHIEIAPDGRKILSCDRLNLVTILDIENDKIIQWKANRKKVHMWSWSSCGNFVIICCADKSISIWKWDNQELVIEFIKHNHEVHLISLSACGNFLISSSLDKNIKIWKLGDMKNNFQGTEVIKEFYVKNLVKSVKWSQDGEKGFIGDEEGAMAIWDKSLEKLENINVHSKAVTCIDSSRCGSFLVTGSCDRTVKLWRLDMK